MRTKTTALIFIIFSIFFLAPMLLNGDTIKQTYRLSKPQIRQMPDGRELVYFSNSYQLGMVGSPTFPVQKIALLIPPGHIATSVSINLLNPESLNRKINLSPKQPPKHSGKNLTTYVINQQIYNSNQTLTGPEVVVNTHYLFGHAVALAAFCPVEYEPASQTLTYYTEIEVTITTELNFQSVTALNNYRYDEEIRQRLSRLADNFNDMITEYPQQIAEPEYEYLIITIEDFIDAYRPLLSFHNTRGIKTRIVSVEEIYQKMTGMDEPEKIRNYIIQEMQQNGIRYVLLAGDADAHPSGQMQVPIRYLYAEVITGDNTMVQQIPSDLYYAALDGSWNNNNNDKWGEPGEDDLLPELHVARIAADNSNEISALLNKIFTHQDQPVHQDAVKNLMAGQYLYPDPVSFGGDYLDLLIGYQTENGYPTQGLTSDLTITFLYDRDLHPGHWNKSDLIPLINQGQNFIHHLGHSSSRSNIGLSLDDIYEQNFQQLNGIARLNPVIYSQGCDAAKIDVVHSDGSDCIAEEMLSLQNFAVAFIGNTRYGWFNEGQTEGPSLHLHREFINALYGGNISTIAAAHTESRIQSAPFVTAPDQWEPGALRWCFYGINVLGDAALSLWTHEIKTFDNVVHPETAAGSVQILTQVPGARVAISTNSDLITVAICDSNGSALVSLDDSFSNTILTLIITAPNYQPFIKNINLSPLPSSVMQPLTDCKPAFELKTAYPNPFNPAATIEFSISQWSQVRLQIFNILGQRVRTLLNEELTSGVHKTIWDGRDDRGEQLTNGVYLIQLSTNEGKLIKSCTLMK
ncbi:MAG: C25 family cysteine peptidase [bacterium]|nr:C25 family cysteine peptidase [bacterium]